MSKPIAIMSRDAWDKLVAERDQWRDKSMKLLADLEKAAEENQRLKAELAGTLIPHSARCLEMEKALVAESKVRKLESELDQARQAMRTWETGAVKDKAEIDRLKAELEKFKAPHFSVVKLEVKIQSLERQLSVAKEALEKSVKLQSHYAGLLNSYDRGERLTFANADQWLERLQKLGETGEAK